MKVVKARVTEDGKRFTAQNVELFTAEETKAKLAGKVFGKDWDIGADIYDTKQTNKVIGWTVDLGNGYCFFSEYQFKG